MTVFARLAAVDCNCDRTVLRPSSIEGMWFSAKCCSELEEGIQGAVSQSRFYRPIEAKQGGAMRAQGPDRSILLEDVGDVFGRDCFRQPGFELLGGDLQPGKVDQRSCGTRGRAGRA